MPNLVGIGNSQVPTNAMLGGLAYQDSVGEINLEKIKARTGDTATDIFVYDTRKDSDGGAWRKRTKNTSWYNEDESGTRGARKEFPVVAVIVMESTQCTIYDADDPNLSMWMVFNFGSGSGIEYKTMFYAGGKAVFALNGMICFGGNSGWKDGVAQVKLIEDTAFWRNGTYVAYWTGGIANRNIAGGYNQFITDAAKLIANQIVNDIAMTVLPNAPIDAETGLPTPTIAVATDGGVSVIKDNGSVVDHTDSANGQSTQVAFTQDGKLTHSHDGHTGIRIDSLKSSDFSYGSNKVARHNSEEFYINYGLLTSGWSGNVPKLNSGAFSSGGQIVPAQDNILAENANTGLNLLARDFPGSPDNNRVAYITSSYNTGWMIGDIKGALLSSTDATDVTGSELVTNGNFDSDVSLSLIHI